MVIVSTAGSKSNASPIDKLGSIVCRVLAGELVDGNCLIYRRISLQIECCIFSANLYRCHSLQIVHCLSYLIQLFIKNTETTSRVTFRQPQSPTLLPTHVAPV